MEIVTTKVREEIIEYLRKELLGPAAGFPAIQLDKEEILRSQDPPRLRYSAGVLCATRCEVPEQFDIDEKEIGDAEAGPSEESDASTQIEERPDLSDSANPIDQQPETELDLNLANQYLPSAMGVSA